MTPAAPHELAPGLSVARGGPGLTLNVYLLGDVVVDSGVRWSHRRLARQLSGQTITAHALSHAHADHAGSSAWLCRAFDVPLWCGAGDASAIGSGRVDNHGSRFVNRVQRTLLPVAACEVTRELREGDVVGGFEVLEGPAPGGRARVSASRQPTADIGRASAPPHGLSRGARTRTVAISALSRPDGRGST